MDKIQEIPMWRKQQQHNLHFELYKANIKKISEQVSTWVSEWLIDIEELGEKSL